MGFFKDLQKASYRVQRASGDLNALERGTLVKRLVRRRVTRTIMRPYDRAWKAWK